MTRNKDREDSKKREEIQKHFWNEVGTVEHISVPMLKSAIEKGFKCRDHRFVQAQIDLMQTEARIGIESRNKVWIKRPQTDT